ncbi:MAG: 2-dehydropantoate 2-reductase [Candidatus Omnitrophica bacterium]|nr:2-dehydropantoate 2-reductase [Candidatus Omnitrophota bacterium]
MKIVVVGPGAIGCLVAALLAKTKEEVWLLDKESERAKFLDQHGIKIEGLANFEVKIPTTSDPQKIKTADIVIICVKSYDTKKAILHAKALIGDKTIILTLQNGLGNIELINEVLDDERTIGAVTNMGATKLVEGHIRYAGKGETIIGSLDGSIGVSLRDIRELFIRAGIQTRISRDIKSALWSKLIINVGINPLTALTRLPNGKLLVFEGTRLLMSQAVTEAVKVCRRKKIKLLFEDPLSKVEAVCEATATNISSMLQDVLRKKRTEIDAINGVIVRLGQELNVPVPVNSMLVSLVKTLEESYSYTVAEVK